MGEQLGRFAFVEESTVLLTWTEQLATGMPGLDDEHRQLIDLINAVGHLHQRQASAEALRLALSDLRDYTVYHFRTEARLMQRYPIAEANRRAHLAAHRGFVERLDEFDALVETNPGAVIECLMAFMVKWLVHHVSGVDVRLAREIAAIESGAPAPQVDPSDSSKLDILIDTVSDLYEGMATRTLELLRANQRLEQEIARRRAAERELRVSAIVFDAVDEAVMVTDADNRIIRVNPAFTRITGFTADDAVGANPRIMSGGSHPPEFYRELWSSLLTKGKWQGEIRNRRKNGELYVEWLSIYRVIDESSGATRHVAVFSDITHQRIEADRIQYLANYDLLTGLPSRGLLVDRLHQALETAHSEDRKLAVLFVDLDHFKAVNDARGHDVGDRLLAAAAARMQECVDRADTVARHGGDEFVVLLSQFSDPQLVVDAAHKLRDALCEPFDVAGYSLRISCSIGIAIFPEHGADAAQLLKSADSEMYRAKAGGRNAVAYPD